jgi:hypothetical protein
VPSLLHRYGERYREAFGDCGADQCKGRRRGAIAIDNDLHGNVAQLRLKMGIAGSQLWENLLDVQPMNAEITIRLGDRCLFLQIRGAGKDP